MLEQGSISNPYQLLIYVLIGLAFLMIIFKFGNWLEAWEPKAKEKKSNKKKKEKAESVKEEKPKEEPKKETDSPKEEKKDEKATKEKVVAKDIKIIAPQSYSNYLYDRFVDSPSQEDNREKTVISSAFISDNDHKAISDREINIRVKEVEDISVANPDKEQLYKKIQEMANENIENKERLLSQFESLPREMKLLLIENIMNKM
ncbi:MAG: hypothetical protein IJW59_03425 [Clostridia bacterium]|nr:hypothetical protein [Clostridia bacterium]